MKIAAMLYSEWSPGNGFLNMIEVSKSYGESLATAPGPKGVYLKKRAVVDSLVEPWYYQANQPLMTVVPNPFPAVMTSKTGQEGLLTSIERFQMFGAGQGHVTLVYVGNYFQDSQY